MKSTLFFQSIATPRSNVILETFSRRVCTAFQSIETPFDLTPRSAPSSVTSANTSAVCRTVFAGMQAKLRQRPPALSFSITAVFWPSCPARIAAT